MVCTFFIFVLPALLWKAFNWLWSLFSGKKQAEPVPQVDGQADAKVPAAVAKGTCPYHAFMRFFGFKIPDKKVVEAPQQEPAADQRVKAE